MPCDHTEGRTWENSDAYVYVWASLLLELS